MLAVRPQANGIFPLGRETFLAPVKWKDGWPEVNSGEPIGLTVQASLPSTAPVPDWKDDFDGEHLLRGPELIVTGDALASGWYHLRTPVGHEYSLHERDSHLTLLGGGYTIRDAECPSIILRKQTALNGLWSTVIDFDPQTAYEEAGTVVYLTGYSYISLFLRASVSGIRQVVAHWPAESGEGFEVSVEVSPLADATGNPRRSLQ
jgi:beta-xylosidase